LVSHGHFGWDAGMILVRISDMFLFDLNGMTNLKLLSASRLETFHVLLGNPAVIFPMFSQAEDHVAAGAFGEVRRR
jgi:hypothetical protein